MLSECVSALSTLSTELCKLVGAVCISYTIYALLEFRACTYVRISLTVWTRLLIETMQACKIR